MYRSILFLVSILIATPLFAMDIKGTYVITSESDYTHFQTVITIGENSTNFQAQCVWKGQHASSVQVTVPSKVTGKFYIVEKTAAASSDLGSTYNCTVGFPAGTYEYYYQNYYHPNDYLLLYKDSLEYGTLFSTWKRGAPGRLGNAYPANLTNPLSNIFEQCKSLKSNSANRLASQSLYMTEVVLKDNVNRSDLDKLPAVISISKGLKIINMSSFYIQIRGAASPAYASIKPNDRPNFILFTGICGGYIEISPYPGKSHWIRFTN